MIIQDGDDFTNPKSSDGEITIVTPENKTYTEPDSGYYPATYGFENDYIGMYPECWQVDDSGGKIQVIDYLNGHNDVVEIYDSSPLGRPLGAIQMNHPFSPISSGVVELWVRTSDSTNYTGITIYDGDENNAVYFGLTDTGNIGYYDGTWNIIRSYYADTWYHLSFEFDTSQNWNVSINGVKYGPYNFRGAPTDMDNLIIVGGSIGLNYYIYVDAVGFSWDRGYNIGDNLNEGLLLSYDNTTNLDWQGYSLDGGVNRTIMGNKTIPIPSDGTHRVQVFGNDTMGTMYESTVRYFSVDTIPPEISIIYPSTAQEFNTPPSYILSITEENIATMWYTLNGGSNNPIASDTGTIDSSAWNSLADGPVTIRFYVRDIADREAFDEVIVVKIADGEPPIPPGIPGYSLIALIGVTLAVTLILAKRKLKK